MIFDFEPWQLDIDIDLTKVALGVLQLLERRQPPEQAGGREQQQEQQVCTWRTMP